MLLTMALAVMLVACANVAGLLTSRAPARAREIAVRLAIGAGRRRLVRQLVTETLLIAIAGGAAGIALAYGAIGLLQLRDDRDRHRRASDVPRRDRRVIGFVAIVMAAAEHRVAGLIPAWRSARLGDLAGTLRTAPTVRRSGGHGCGAGTPLVAGQVALALALVTVAVFLYRTFSDEFERGPGFRTDHVLLVNVDPALGGYDPRARTALLRAD